MAPPSGQQLVIAWEDQEATIVGVGGGLRLYEADGQQVLDGYGLDEMCPGGRGQPLIPWPSRLRRGAYRYDGAEHQLPLNDVAALDAVDGLVGWTPWDVRDHQARWVTVEHTLYPRPGYPFLLELAITYELSDEGLRVEHVVENRGARRAPVGAGQRAYLLPPAGALAGAVLDVPARSRAPAAGCGPDRPATAYRDLVRDADGVCAVGLSSGGRVLRLWMDRGFRHVTAAAGGPGPARSFAIQIASCPANALATGEDLVLLAPGERWSAAWGVRLAPAADRSM